MKRMAAFRSLFFFIMCLYCQNCKYMKLSELNCPKGEECYGEQVIDTPPYGCRLSSEGFQQIVPGREVFVNQYQYECTSCHNAVVVGHSDVHFLPVVVHVEGEVADVVKCFGNGTCPEEYQG